MIARSMHLWICFFGVVRKVRRQTGNRPRLKNEHVSRDNRKFHIDTLIPAPVDLASEFGHPTEAMLIKNWLRRVLHWERTPDTISLRCEKLARLLRAAPSLQDRQGFPIDPVLIAFLRAVDDSCSQASCCGNRNHQRVSIRWVGGESHSRRLRRRQWHDQN